MDSCEQFDALKAKPMAGRLVGHHEILREITNGTSCPIYLAHSQKCDGSVGSTADKLVRLIPLAEQVSRLEQQIIVDAIWDSTIFDHDLALQVVDIVSGSGAMVLVHDYRAGTPLALVHRNACDAGQRIPVEIALRIALDLVEGIESSRELCETRGVPWRPGCVSMQSLYLCDDGRTRALDGTAMGAVLRSPCMRDFLSNSLSIAPELFDDVHVPDERTDVFAVAMVLAELLADRDWSLERGSSVAGVVTAAAVGAHISHGLVRVLCQALDAAASNRQSTLQGLAAEVVIGAGRVATHAEVASFVSLLLPVDVNLHSDVSGLHCQHVDRVNDVERVFVKVAAASAVDPYTRRCDEAISPNAIVPANETPLAKMHAPRYPSPFGPDMTLLARRSPATNPSSPALTGEAGGPTVAGRTTHIESTGRKSACSGPGRPTAEQPDAEKTATDAAQPTASRQGVEPEQWDVVAIPRVDWNSTGEQRLEGTGRKPTTAAKRVSCAPSAEILEPVPQWRRAIPNARPVVPILGISMAMLAIALVAVLMGGESSPTSAVVVLSAQPEASPVESAAPSGTVTFATKPAEMSASRARRSTTTTTNARAPTVFDLRVERRKHLAGATAGPGLDSGVRTSASADGAPKTTNAERRYVPSGL